MKDRILRLAAEMQWEDETLLFLLLDALELLPDEGLACLCYLQDQAERENEELGIES